MKNRVPRLSDGGFGLIEVIIAAAIVSVIALGITTLVEDMFRMQRRANALATLTQMRGTLTSAIQNGESWKQTANDAAAATGNPSMSCMRAVSPSVCTLPGPPGPPVGYIVNLKDTAGNPLFYSTDATLGFRVDGSACNNYPAESCPFRWDIRWTGSCPGGAPTCMTPSVTVTGTLQYFTAATSIPGGFNPDNYNFTLLRGSEAIRNDAVIVNYTMNTVTPDGEGAPTDTCKNVWYQRKLNWAMQDQGNNLMNKVGAAPVVLSTADVVQLHPGTYTCRVQVPGFKNGGNRIRIRAVSGTMFPNVESSVAIGAMNGGSVVNTIETTLVLSQETVFAIDHTCTNDPGDTSYGSTQPNWSLGAPITNGGTYNGVIYTTVACTRTS